MNEAEDLLGKMKRGGMALLQREDGRATLEYAVLLALIVGACLTVIGFLSPTISRRYAEISRALTTVGKAVREQNADTRPRNPPQVTRTSSPWPVVVGVSVTALILVLSRRKM